MSTLNIDNSHWEWSKRKGHTFSGPLRKKDKKSEFKKILEQTLIEQKEDWEEFRILLPKHGQFWDNGYEDLK